MATDGEPQEFEKTEVLFENETLGVYDGEIKGSMHDKDGASNQMQYRGQQQNGRPHGFGVMSVKHGDTHYGQYVDGRCHGLLVYGSRSASGLWVDRYENGKFLGVEGSFAMENPEHYDVFERAQEACGQATKLLKESEKN